MARRASHAEGVGGGGLNEVAADFQRLGWGAAPNYQHDLGTDLFLMARDERRFDLGLLVGAQVKTGPSYFREPRRDHGELVGWWYRESTRSHFDHWLSHSLPHLIILRDQVERVSYWGHVETSAVIAAGARGAKICVPRAQTVTEDNFASLVAVAGTQRPATAWEGSAWTGAGSLPPKDQLRHAMLAPRLVAPHPNLGARDTISAAQGVALLMQARVRHLQRFAAEHEDVPGEALSSPEWSWRFVGALERRISDGETDSLRAVLAEAEDPEGRTAAAVAYVAALMQDGRADEALLALEEVLARDDAEPIDQAWLRAQHARTCAEIGRVADARLEAVEVQRIRLGHADDVCAAAIASVAAGLLFSTSGWGERDVADVVASSDIATTWWRTQTIAGGLEDLADRTFRSWAQEDVTVSGSDDRANDELFAAALNANHTGDQGQWRHLYSLLAQDALMRGARSADSGDVSRQLDALRNAGDREAIKLAAVRLVNDGPAAAIRLVGAHIGLHSATRTTGLANLILLELGGDLLDEDAADRSAAWLLATIADSSAFEQRTTPSYLVSLQLIDSLTGVVLACSDAARADIVHRLGELPSQGHDLVDNAWTRLVNAIPPDDWDETSAELLGANADRHSTYLRQRFRAIAARFDVQLRDALVEEVRAGSLDALASLGDVRTLEGDVVTPMIGALGELCRAKIAAAEAGSYGIGGTDVGRALALLDLWHVPHADWETLIALLDTSAVAGSDKAGAFEVLASLERFIPNELRQRFLQIARAYIALAKPFQDVGGFFDATGPASELAALLAEPDDPGVAGSITSLLSGDASSRRWAARLTQRSNHPDASGLLAALAHDVDPTVRATAASALAQRVAAGTGGTLALPGLLSCMNDPGTHVPIGIAAALAEAPVRTPLAEALMAALTTHQSALVRNLAVRGQAGTGGSG